VPRGPSARSYLAIEWDYPVYATAEEEPVAGSSAKKKRQALSRAEALAYIAGEDTRPLLVLRECKVCNGTDDALLKPGADNEKTFLLSRWFHCVKLPVDVMDEDHPFHELFTLEAPEHLFVVSANGGNHDPLESQTSRTELWGSMRDLVALEYASKPDSALKKIASILDKLDAADQRVLSLLEDRDDILEEDGPDSRKLPKLQKRIAAAEAERDELHAEIAEASRLELKRQSAGEAEAGK